MKYCTINKQNAAHIKNIYNWLLLEVLSSGGDGDGIWYSRFYNVNDIINLLKDETDKFWNIKKESEETYLIYNNQESLLITNNKNTFDNRPKEQQVSLEY